jgi:hypothetical protein
MGKLYSVTIFTSLLITINISVLSQTSQKMDMGQTLSDGAQKATIAFSGLAFLTGEEESYTFLPPGKLADYFGFQYLRDNDITGMGHNTDFVTKSANNMNMFVYSSAQNYSSTGGVINVEIVVQYY